MTSYLGVPDEDVYDVPSDESGGGLGPKVFYLLVIDYIILALLPSKKSRILTVLQVTVVTDLSPQGCGDI